MSSIKKYKLTIKLKKEEFEPPRISGGLMKSHKIIRAERIRESQFLKLCAQIQLNDNKQSRSDCQRSQRILKRKQTIIVND